MTSTTEYIVRAPFVGHEACVSTVWIRDRPFESQWFNALSLRLPDAERYGIDVVKQAISLIKDASLIRRAKGFVAQEAVHSNQHNKCNVALRSLGLRVAWPRYTQWRYGIAAKFGVLHGLALTVAWEHFTAIFCEHALAHSELESRSEDPFKTLWIWHCIEELEHRSLANDLYIACGGGWLMRYSWYCYATLLFLFDYSFQMLLNCLLSRNKSGVFDILRDAVRYLFGDNSFAVFFCRRWLRFFSSSYNPQLDDVDDLIKKAQDLIGGKYKIIGNGAL